MQSLRRVGDDSTGTRRTSQKFGHTLDQWKSVLWSDEMFASTRHGFVRHRKSEQVVSTCVVPTVGHGGGGVMVSGCFVRGTVDDLFTIQDTLNLHGYLETH